MAPPPAVANFDGPTALGCAINGKEPLTYWGSPTDFELQPLTTHIWDSSSSPFPKHKVTVSRPAPMRAKGKQPTTLSINELMALTTLAFFLTPTFCQKMVFHKVSTARFITQPGDQAMPPTASSTAVRIATLYLAHMDTLSSKPAASPILMPPHCDACGLTLVGRLLIHQLRFLRLVRTTALSRTGASRTGRSARQLAIPSLRPARPLTA